MANKTRLRKAPLRRAESVVAPGAFLFPRDPMLPICRQIPKQTCLLVEKAFQPIARETEFGECQQKQLLPSYYYSKKKTPAASARKRPPESSRSKSASNVKSKNKVDIFSGPEELSASGFASHLNNIEIFRPDAGAADPLDISPRRRSARHGDGRHTWLFRVSTCPPLTPGRSRARAQAVDRGAQRAYSSCYEERPIITDEILKAWT